MRIDFNLFIKYTVYIIMIALIVGGAVYYAIHKDVVSQENTLQNQINDLNATISNLNKEISTLKSTNGSSSSSSNTSFLTIPELGIKLPLTSSISDLVYTYTSLNTSQGVFHYLNFSTKAIETIKSSSSPSGVCDASADPLGIYLVFTTPQTNGVQIETLESHVGNYYIYYGSTQGVCAASLQDQAKITPLVDPLLTAVQNAQVAN